MLRTSFLAALLGVTTASPFIPTVFEGGNPIPVCGAGNTTVTTCCRNDWIEVTPELAKYPGYACGYPNTGIDPKECIVPALAICCTQTQGIIVPFDGDRENIYQPKDFRCHNLEGGIAE